MKQQHGITLIEMTIILAIIGLLIASLLVPFTAQMDIAKIGDTKKTLEQIRQVLIDYATINDRLPCPATEAEIGMEDQGNCENEGYLPWANLGLGRNDAWGNPFRYGVAQDYTGSGKSSNKITIQDTQSNNSITAEISAVIFSYGKNGQSDQPSSAFLSGFFSGNWLFSTAFAGNNDQIYSQGSIVPNGGYDDILVFLSKTALASTSQQLQSLKPSLMTSQVKPVEDAEEYTPTLPIGVGSGVRNGNLSGGDQNVGGGSESTSTPDASTDASTPPDDHSTSDPGSQVDENHASITTQDDNTGNDPTVINDGTGGNINDNTEYRGGTLSR